MSNEAETPSLAEPAARAPKLRLEVTPLGDPAVVRVPIGEETQSMLALRERLMADSVKLRRIDVPVILDEQVSLALGAASETETATLTRHSVRGKDFRVLVPNATGGYDEMDPGPVRTYMGRLTGDSHSTVAVTVLPDGIRGRIQVPGAPDQMIEPLTDAESLWAASTIPGDAPLHAVYIERPLDIEEFNCASGHDHDQDCPAGVRAISGSMTMASAKDAPVSAPPPPDKLPGDQWVTATGPTVSMKQAELGVDVAYTFYANRSSSDIRMALANIETWLNADLNPCFMQGAQIEHVLGTVMIRTTSASCPYYGNGSAQGSGGTLELLRAIWNGDNTTYGPRPSTTHDLAHCALSQSQGVTGLAWVGVIGEYSRYNIATAGTGSGNDGDGYGYWRSGARHEIGHNWNLSHGDGYGRDEITPWRDSFGIIGGGFHERLNTIEAQKITSERNSKSGYLVDLGTFTGFNVPPYCPQIRVSAQAGGGPITFDVLANAYDANNESVTLTDVRVDYDGGHHSQEPPQLVTTGLGGTVIALPRGGPEGRDQLIYTPPVTASVGDKDIFTFGIADNPASQTNTWARKSAWGSMLVTILPSPPPAFGEPATACVIADSLYDWDPDTQGAGGWEYGYYSSGETFARNTTPSTFAAGWVGGDNRIWSQAGGSAPNCGQYAMNPSSTLPAVRRWTSGFEGTVAIEYDARRLRAGGDGMYLKIYRNGSVLMSHILAHADPNAISNPNALMHAGTVYTDVSVGDTIDFMVHPLREGNAYDWVQFHGRVLDAACARDEGDQALRFPLDTGVEMARGEQNVFETRSWAADMSGNNHHLQFQGHDPDFSWRGGIVGNAFEANGSSGYGITPESSIGDGATEITLSAWVRPNAKSDNDAAVSCTGPDFTGLLVSGYGSGNPGEFRCRHNRVTAPDDSVPVGRWTHMVGVWKSGAFQRLYLDGVEVGSNPSPPGGTLDVDQWIVGNDRLDTARAFNGMIDDVTLWTRAFSADEVLALYTETRPYDTLNGGTTIRTMENTFLEEHFTEMTMAAWCRPARKGDWNGILTTGTATDEDYFGLMFSHGAGNPIHFRAASLGLSGPDHSLPEGTWAHAVGVWKAGEIQKLYLNGLLVAETPQPQVATSPASVNTWVMGRDRDISGRELDGDVDEPLILSRALGDAEVMALFLRNRTHFNSAQTRLPGSTPIGAPALDGLLAEASGVYSLSAAGASIGGAADSLQFAPLNASSGKQDIVMQIVAQTPTTVGALAGIMMRTATDADAPFVMLARRVDGALGIMQRTHSGDPVTMPVDWQTGSADQPVWLRLLRAGDGVAGRFSTDGLTWTQLGYLPTNLPSDTPIGIAVTSATQRKSTVAAISDISASGLGADATDIDEDGLLDSWEMDHFGSLTVSNGEGNDWDHDGASDSNELGAGTDPKDPLSYLGLSAESEALANGDIRLSWQAVAGKTYKIVSKAHLSDPTWIDVLTGIPATVPITAREVTPPSGTHWIFYGILVDHSQAP